MGGGGMLGIVLIVALVAWGVVRCWRSHQKVIPTEGTTDSGFPLAYKGKVSPFTTTAPGIEDLSEFPSRGDSLKHKESHNFDFKDKQGMIIDDSSPMKPVPPAPPLQKKNTALEVLQKKREEFQ
jgi:hypothetical protein